MASNPLSPSLEKEIRVLLEALLAYVGSHQFRQIVVLSGSRAWCVEALRSALLATASDDEVLWISSDAPPAYQAHTVQASALLGRETDFLVFDAFSGFNPDSFGLVAGSIRAGGLLFLLIPPLEDWPRFADPEKIGMAVYPHTAEEVGGLFLQRLAAILVQHSYLIREGGRIPAAPSFTSSQENSWYCAKDSGIQALCRTNDQWLAVQAILKVVTGGRRRPLVLEADRGRGKSAALGIAAGHLLAVGSKDILLTGPHLTAVEAVFQMARCALPEASASRTVLSWAGRRLYYLSPDEIARTLPPAQLLLIDEAAAIPVPLLEKLLAGYSRVVFATTLHGYEGTGRGFAIRFQKILERRSRACRRLLMTAPIRWATGDPLERLVFDALLLQATPAPSPTVAKATLAQCQIMALHKPQLLADERLLSELFGLLVSAHYRTSPYDLRYLLDSPNVTVYAMRYQSRVVATALVAGEGGFDTKTADKIWAGKRRPRGHLLPEALATHLGLAEAPTQRYARVMRIAVHPALQGQGLGTYLLDYLSAQAQANGLDTIGSSFGATPELLRFWRKANFLPVRISNKRGAASGAHSVVVLHPLSEPGKQLFKQARDYLHYQLPHQLADPLRELDPDLAQSLLWDLQALKTVLLEERDEQGIAAFVAGRQSYEACVACLWQGSRLALSVPTLCKVLAKKERELLIRKVLQRQPWAQVAKAMNMKGRAGVINELRLSLAKAYENLPSQNIGTKIKCVPSKNG